MKRWALGWVVVAGFGLGWAISGCDGYANDVACANGRTQACGTDLGECKAGQQVCQNGQWSACSGTMPAEETCDGLDNNCDGVIDEGCACKVGETRTCGQALGICQPGLQRCTDGMWGSCGDASADKKYVAPRLEVCDGLDNNCDGVIDEGCDCPAGAARWCSAGEGVCRSGQQTCQDGRWGDCTPTQSSGPELCDGLDNDCNGVVDEGFDLDVPCDAIGKCPQTRVCSADGKTSVCADDPRLFSVERCDGIDNDCDGLVDFVSDGGSLQSVCQCEERILAIGDASDSSIMGNLNLCAPTQCGGDQPQGLLVDGKCYPGCHASTPTDSDGWGWENGASCLLATKPRGLAAAPCNGFPVGMAITYCLQCSVTNDLPYAMCQTVPRFDLRAFALGEKWLKVDYTFSSKDVARAPINLWFHAGGDLRKHLPLVRIGDVPGNYQALLRAEDACFTASAAFGSGCPGSGSQCAHCGDKEVCGALVECGGYDLSQAWLQIAAEFCPRGSGQHNGTVVVNQVTIVDPNCQP